jgi:hypothetical protein
MEQCKPNLLTHFEESSTLVGYSQVSSFFENFIKHFLFELLLVLTLLGGSPFFLREIISSSLSFRVVYENWPGFSKYKCRVGEN